MEKAMKYFSLFSGIGGFELGIQQAYEDLQKLRIKDKRQSKGAPIGNTKGRSKQLPKLGVEGLSCIGYSEIDKYAIQIYQKHFPEHKNYGDITKINASTLPDFDLLVGGFPCQSFSIAGKRRGFEDTRGTLFFEIARLVKEKQPRLLLLENVKGLLSHDQGRTFTTIISTLDELGYDLQWQVLNSKNFGVPQNRERVFIVGHLRGTSRPEVFPFTTGSQKDIEQLNTPIHSNDRIYSEEGISPTLNTMQGGRRQPKIHCPPHGYNKGWVKELPNLRAHSGAPHNEILDGIRRLTPTECERLQGFPDGWTESGVEIVKPEMLGEVMGEVPMSVQISDTQRYKCCGNAVTVNVIRHIIERMVL